METWSASFHPAIWGVSHWAMEVATSSDAEFRGHYETALDLPRAPDLPLAVTCGRSLIIGSVIPDVASQTAADDLRRLGFRYTTLQVWNVDETHARVLAWGGHEGAPPKTLGQTARISFIKDADGNWMELSQRASITGSLDA
jgi:hypothetical protein